MNPESDDFLKEVRDFYWQYLQEHAKKENASIEHINEGVKLLERLETSQAALCEDKSPKEDASSETADAKKDKFWDFSPDSTFGRYLDFLQNQLSSRAGHRNTQHHQGN